MRPFSDGDYIFCEIDLQAGTCAFWLEGPDSHGRTLGPPSGARFSYAACFPQFQVGNFGHWCQSLLESQEGDLLDMGLFLSSTTGVRCRSVLSCT